MHQLQSDTLELCFFVVLDKLLHGSGSGAWSGGVGIECARHGAQAFACAATPGCADALKQPLLAIRVELKQLVFSIARSCSSLW